MTEQQTHHDETIPPDLQATADLLRDALAAEPVPPAQTPARAPGPAKKTKLPIQFVRFALPAAVAAAILLMFGFVFGTMYTQRTQTPMAIRYESTNVEPPEFTGSRVDLASVGDVGPESDGGTPLYEMEQHDSPATPPEPLMRNDANGQSLTEVFPKTSVEDMVNRARALRREKKYAEAYGVLKGIVEHDPSNEWVADNVVALGQQLMTQELKKARHLPAVEMSKQTVDLSMTPSGGTAASRAMIPWYAKVRYPRDWKKRVASHGGHAYEYTSDFTRINQTGQAGISSESDMEDSGVVTVQNEALAALKSEADRRTHQQLQQRLSVRLIEQELPAVMEYLREVASVNIYVDWGELEKINPDIRAKQVTVLLKHVTVQQALEAVLKNAGGGPLVLAHAIQTGVVVVGTEARIEKVKRQGWNREGYDSLPENEFLASLDNPLSTFSIDVDTASYANMRRFLNRGQLPPAGSIRIEELVNYFNYDYAPPATGDDHPFAAHLAVADCPWAPNHRLVRVALKGKEIADADRPASNLVFLLDVSGSMSAVNKLTLVKESMTLLTQRLDERDKVAIVVYAGAAGVVLPSTCASDRNAILGALSKLKAGGSTAGGAGITLAYKIAAENYIKGGTNRVILCTDGDFNVGTTSEAGLEKLITEKAKTGVFLTVLGFGMGNYQDGRLEKLADKGNGTYGYIDNEKEARKHFVEGLTGTLVTIAKDVKIQVEFNPAEVAAYRLIGYENRMLAKEDFNDDTKDAGEIGAGHTVTALYEIVPAGSVRNVANRIARLKERAAAMQKQITEWTAQLPKLNDEKRNDQVQVIAEMVQMRGDLLAGIKAMETMQAKQAKATPVKTGTVDPLKYITPTALSKEAKTGEMLTLKLRYKQPEGEKSILMQQSLTDKGVRFAQADREFQVAAMVAQFGMQLRGSKHAGNYSLAGVAETLTPLVQQYDPHKHRVELLNLVKKAAAMKK